MKEKLLPLLIVGVLVGLGLLVGSRLFASVEISAGSATQLRAEGDKAVLDAQAQEIRAETARTDARAEWENAQLAHDLDVDATRDTQTTAMFAGWKKTGTWAGAGLLLAVAISGAYFFGHRGWIVNDRLRRAPVMTQRGTIVVTVFPDGGATVSDLSQPGLVISRSVQGVFALHGADPQVLSNAALALAIRGALIHQVGLPRGEASRVVSELRQLMAPAGATSTLPAEVDTS